MRWILVVVVAVVVLLLAHVNALERKLAAVDKKHTEAFATAMAGSLTHVCRRMSSLEARSSVNSEMISTLARVESVIKPWNKDADYLFDQCVTAWRRVTEEARLEVVSE